MNLPGWLHRLWHRPMSAKKIHRVAALAANPFAQPDVRCRQMERLLADGSTAALKGVLQRFGALAQGHIADEEEKTWLAGALVEKGASALLPLSDYIRHSNKLTYALRAYLQIAKPAASADFFAQTLRAYDLMDHRSATAKVQLISALAECAPAERLVAWVAPSVGDVSDDVVQAALHALPAGSLPPADAAALMPQVLQRLAHASSPPRVLRMLLLMMAERGWALPPSARQLPAACADDFHVDDSGRVHLGGDKRGP